MSNDRLIKKEILSAREAQEYLEDAYQKGRKYYAIELNGLSRKLTADELKPLEKLLDSELSKDDLKQLRKLLKVLQNKPAREGMIVAYQFDTYLRELLPATIWKKMGGKML